MIINKPIAATAKLCSRCLTDFIGFGSLVGFAFIRFDSLVDFTGDRPNELITLVDSIEQDAFGELRKNRSDLDSLLAHLIVAHRFFELLNVCGRQLRAINLNGEFVELGC